MSQNEYYVYVYIDPRDYTEFYYGKGCGDRKNAHLKDDKDTEKTKIIAEIKKQDLRPIIRIIARNLTEPQAFLIEKVLIWKLGRNLANISTGTYAENFRPHKTMHRELFGFDYKNGIYFFNCGDSGDNNRKWEDFKEYGFITAGGGKKYSDPIRSFEVGDVALVYLSKHGYVGICKILSMAVVIDEFKINNMNISNFNLRGNYKRIGQPEDRKEYMCNVKWISAVDRKNAFMKKNSGLYTPQLVKALMQNQQETIKLVSEHFKIDIQGLLDVDNKNGLTNR